MASYSYLPLSQSPLEFRLLTLEPGPWDADIKCQLHHSVIQQKPVYEVLSYTWGDPEDPHTILLNEFPHKITRNLEEALRYLRHPDTKRTLWIDALCINQTDLKEKAVQVPKMYEIFSSASMLLAWVGPPKDESSKALNEIQQIAAKFVAAGIDATSYSLTPDELQHMGIDPEKVGWDVIWALLSRPYWKRMWVLQELATCGTWGPDGDLKEQDRGYLWCGFDSIPLWVLDSFFLLVLILGRSPAFVYGGLETVPTRALLTRALPPAFNMIQTLLQLNNNGKIKSRTKLWQLMQFTQTFFATDAHDKVFALLGVTCEEHKRQVVPNYSEPVDTLFTNVVKSMIRVENALECLLYNRFELSRYRPSWIPAVQTEHYAAGGGMAWDDYYGLFKASGATEPQVEFDDTLGALLAKGVEVENLSHAIGPFSSTGLASANIDVDHADYDALKAALGKTQLQHGQDVTAYFKTLDLSQYEAFWRCLIMDADRSDWYNFISPAPQSIEAEFRHAYGVTHPPEVFDRTKVPRFYSNMGECMVNRCFIATPSGLMGWGPYHSKVGDLVVSLFGASRLVTLRPRDDGYELIGDAYVQNGMHGEFLREYLDGKTDVAKTFRIY